MTKIRKPDSNTKVASVHT